MTDFWVSKKQYWCKYCSTFIRDDAPSRMQHETGFRHQGNKERFLRDIYKSGERAVRDKEEERRIMERIDKAANEAHEAANAPVATASSSTSFTSTAQPIASSSKLPTPSSSKPTKPTSSSTDPYANYSSAASLGYIDTEAVAAEKAAALAAERSKLGEIGGWETVTESSVIPLSRAVGTGAVAGAGAQDEEEEDARYALNRSTDNPDEVDRFRHRNAINALHGSLGADEAEEARSHDFAINGHGSGPGGRGRGKVYHRVAGDDDDEWDPEEALKLAALKGKVKIQEETIMERKEREAEEASRKEADVKRRGLDRKNWGGVVVGKDGQGAKLEIKEEVKPHGLVDGASKPAEPVAPSTSATAPTSITESTTAQLEAETKPNPDEVELPVTGNTGSNSMFRKRKGGGAAGRSVRQKT